jgi:hypothetical protein
MEEWKTEDERNRLAEHSPNRDRQGAGRWHCPPGENYAGQFGLYYRLPLFQRNRLAIHRNALFSSGLMMMTTTVTSVCRHFGISPTYFQLNFPEDNKELVRRSAERARRARTDRARALQKEVYEIICVLRQKGLYPSLPRVRCALHPGSTRYSPLIRSAIDEARAIFGPIMRQRNELGRFV